MSGFLVILISLVYVIIAAVVFGVIYAVTEDDFKAAFGCLLWPIFIIVIPLGLLIYFIVKKLKIR